MFFDQYFSQYISRNEDEEERKRFKPPRYSMQYLSIIYLYLYSNK